MRFKTDYKSASPLSRALRWVLQKVADVFTTVGYKLYPYGPVHEPDHEKVCVWHIHNYVEGTEAEADKIFDDMQGLCNCMSKEPGATCTMMTSSMTRISMEEWEYRDGERRAEILIKWPATSQVKDLKVADVQDWFWDILPDEEVKVVRVWEDES